MLTKINFLLFILTLSLIGTAITINYSVTDEDILELDRANLTKQIHNYEEKIEKIWQDTSIINAIINRDKSPNDLLNVSQKLLRDNFYLYIYSHHHLSHWSNHGYVPVTDLGLRYNTTLLQTENHSFLAKRQEFDHGITALILIPIQSHYEISNEYLENSFIGIKGIKNLEIASYEDSKNIKNIYSKDKTYLFSIKLIDGKKDNIFIHLQFFCWLTALVCIIVLANNICLYLARKDQAWLSLILFLITLLSLRYIESNSNWLSEHSSLKIFDSKYYTYSEVLPNIWSYLMFTASIFWFLCFFISIMGNLSVPKILKKKTFASIFAVISILSTYACAQLMYHYLGTLLTHSPLGDHDLTKLLTIGSDIWMFVIIYCFNITALALYVDTIIKITKSLLSDTTLLLNIQLACIIAVAALSSIMGLNILFYILLGIFLLIRTFKVHTFASSYKLSIFISTVILLAAITSVSTNQYTNSKKEETMKQSISHLMAEDDLNAISLFIDLEVNINNDDDLSNLLNLDKVNRNITTITEYIKGKYLSGYLSKFESQISIYDNEGKALETYTNNKASQYREDVIKSAIKIPLTNNFYRLKSELGSHEYFTQISIPYGNNIDKNYHIYLSLKNLSYSTSLPYPEVLSDNRVTAWQFENLQTDSYALYKRNKLVTQYGKYSYDDNDAYVPNQVLEYLPLNRPDGYNHLAFRPDDYTTIVLSKEKKTIWEHLAFGSIMFILILLFFCSFNVITYFYRTVISKPLPWNTLKYQLQTIINNIQYSTRIQTLVIVSVLFGILISGAIAFLSISSQLESNKQDDRFREIAEISKKIENNIGNVKDVNDATIANMLKDIAPSTVRNFNLYNQDGKLVYSSQPRIFDLKLISEFINPSALYKLSILHKTEAYEQEKISKFNYASAYASIKGEDYNTIAYLNIPYYTTERDANASKTVLLNTILNIYTFIIIIFAFITGALSSTITKPLDIIRQKLADTQLSNKVNEPLYWAKNDEIGMLIKEYNLMLIKLEESAKQLRDAEREKAWREMAKQIAHEIKNPLTPMKLGIQQLMRSYKEEDVNFKDRFNKTSISIIEQIESLSKIATEFSAFAKLPETKLVKINIVEKLKKVINLFNHSANTTITLINQTKKSPIFVLGDRDQLLRSFNNLFKNSIEASTGRKKIQIDILIRELENNWVEILVKDNGYGIPKEVIPNIFRPNFTTKSSGTGLGLAFVKQTITGAGGVIDYETSTNKGTTFIIILPTYEEKQNFIS